MSAVRMEAVTKRYGAVRALEGVDLDIPEGSVFGLIGPNGAGKTTAFGVVCGWVRSDDGTTRVLDRAPGDVAALKGRIGALPQDAALPPRVPIEQTLTFYGRLQGLSKPAARSEARRVLGMVELSQWGGALGGALSHGMAKRVALAQAFLGDPELVLLDEPTAGLDPKSAHQVRTLIAEARGRATVVVSSHNLYELESLCDRAAILDRGRVRAVGTMAELTEADRDVVIELVEGSESPARFLPALQAVAGVISVDALPDRRRLVIRFSSTDPEMVSTLLRTLLDQGARISEVRRGQGLERKVLSLT